MDRHEGQLGGESGEDEEERDTCIEVGGASGVCIEVGGASGVCIEVGGASGVIINNNYLFIWYSTTSIIVRGASQHITI